MKQEARDALRRDAEASLSLGGENATSDEYVLALLDALDDAADLPCYYSPTEGVPEACPNDPPCPACVLRAEHDL